MATPANSRRTPEGRKWAPGQSGNPSGRPKGIAAKAREIIGDDPSELLEVLLEIAHNPREKAGDRRAAVESLLDRAYGKAPSYAPVDGENPLDLDAVERRILAVLDELADRRQAKTAGGGETTPLAGTGTA